MTDNGNPTRSPVMVDRAQPRRTGSEKHQQSTAMLILVAAAVLRRRCRRTRYRGLTPQSANVLINALTGIATGVAPRHPDELTEAAALAHRILDDDEPDRSDLWTRLLA